MVRPDLHLPPSLVAWLAPFLATFSRRTRSTTAALATGALLAVGPRTDTNCLRALGLAQHPSFTAFHRVLNRNAWSGLALARTLLHIIVATFVPAGPIIIGLDHTLERRRGRRIGPAGRFYDPSLRADMPNPTSRGLRWLSAMVLVEVPFAGRIWGLPVLTALTPSKAWSERQGQRHRTVTEWARLLLLTLRRWLPECTIIAVMDGEFAALELLHALRPSMMVITRMRKDARLFDPPSNKDKPGRPGRKGARQPLLSARVTDPATRWLRVAQSSRASWRSGGWIEYAHGTALWHHGGKPIVPILWVLVRYPDGRREPEAFLCTDASASPRDVLDCFNRRWAVETTYEEARAHLGMETQRQWSDPAIFRTTPILLGLYSVVTLYVHQNAERLDLSPRRAAWYSKPAATFADAIARLRQHLWFERIATSAAGTDITEPISPTIQRIIEAACYAP
ncbi:MAG TPA: transposase [Acidobacteriaceae bacterium]